MENTKGEKSMYYSMNLEKSNAMDNNVYRLVHWQHIPKYFQ